MFRIEKYRLGHEIVTAVFEPYTDRSHDSVVFDKGRAWGDVRTKRIPGRLLQVARTPAAARRVMRLWKALCEEKARELATYPTLLVRWRSATST